MFHDMFCFTVCLFISPDLDGYRVSVTLRDPENCKVPKPKYEAAVLHEHLSIGYPNSSTGSMHNSTALLTGEATNEARPGSIHDRSSLKRGLSRTAL